MKVSFNSEENFKIKCNHSLNIGIRNFDVGDIREIVLTEILEVDDWEMKVYHTKEGIILCDFEIEEYFDKFI